MSKRGWQQQRVWPKGLKRMNIPQPERLSSKDLRDQNQIRNQLDKENLMLGAALVPAGLLALYAGNKFVDRKKNQQDAIYHGIARQYPKIYDVADNVYTQLKQRGINVQSNRFKRPTGVTKSMGKTVQKSRRLTREKITAERGLRGTKANYRLVRNKFRNAILSGNPIDPENETPDYASFNNRMDARQRRFSARPTINSVRSMFQGPGNTGVASRGEILSHRDTMRATKQQRARNLEEATFALGELVGHDYPRVKQMRSGIANYPNVAPGARDRVVTQIDYSRPTPAAFKQRVKSAQTRMARANPNTYVRVPRQLKYALWDNDFARLKRIYDTYGDEAFSLVPRLGNFFDAQTARAQRRNTSQTMMDYSRPTPAAFRQRVKSAQTRGVRANPNYVRVPSPRSRKSDALLMNYIYNAGRFGKTPS